jgi:hypothetical protein
MGWATYVARRDLAPGHSAATTYTLPLVLTEFQKRAGGDLKTVSKAIAGNSEVVYHGRERIWRVMLEPMAEEDTALVREFLGSTADGQEFQFDPYGTPDNPRKEMTVKREDDGADESSFLRNGDPDGTDSVEFSFEVKQVE